MNHVVFVPVVSENGSAVFSIRRGCRLVDICHSNKEKIEHPQVRFSQHLAEAEGFEPPCPFGQIVFKFASRISIPSRGVLFNA